MGLTAYRECPCLPASLQWGRGHIFDAVAMHAMGTHQLYVTYLRWRCGLVWRESRSGSSDISQLQCKDKL